MYDSWIRLHLLFSLSSFLLSLQFSVCYDITKFPAIAWYNDTNTTPVLYLAPTFRITTSRHPEGPHDKPFIPMVASIRLDIDKQASFHL